MFKIDIKDIRRRANGRWFEILNANGIGGEFLKNKNGPCPKCGGNDRWRWDNKNGDGSGFCHQCDLRGSGLTILGRWRNLSSPSDLPKLLQIVSDSLGTVPTPIHNLHDEKVRRKFARDLANKIWNETMPIRIGDPASKYLHSRMLARAPQVQSLRLHPNLEYREEGKIIGCFPALIGRVDDCNGSFMAVNRTYLTPEGQKAPVREPKMALGPIAGGAVHLGEPYDRLALTEGIETGLAVRDLTSMPTWAVMTAGNLEKVRLPESVSEVYIWADLDLTRTGERHANALARKLFHRGLQVFIHLPRGPIPPGKKSLDWLDEFVDIINTTELADA